MFCFCIFMSYTVFGSECCCYCNILSRVIKVGEKYISKILKYSPICDICLAWYSVWLKDEAFKVLLVLEYFIKKCLFWFS